MNTTNNGLHRLLRVVWLVLVLLALCPAKAQQSQDITQSVAYCTLAREPQSFAGKRIRVRAIYKYGFEIQQLDPPTCCAGRGPKIWVEMEPGLQGNSLKLFRKLPKGMGLALATFAGTFESGGPYGDGGYRLKFTVDQIENLEGTAKASPNHNPAWVPENCEKSYVAPTSGNRREYDRISSLLAIELNSAHHHLKTLILSRAI